MSQKKKNFLGDILGVGIIIVAILTGTAEVVAPLMILAFILYMAFRKPTF